jgi:hypothetical protein
MMQDDKLIELFKFYTGAAEAVQLHENEYKRRVALDAIYTNRDGRSRSMRELAVEHAAWMATGAIGFLKDAWACDQYKVLSDASLEEARKRRARSKREKAHRWLGFIQGVLWMGGRYSLDELKEHSRRCSDEPDKPETTT